MKILVATPTYDPVIGGLERVSELLASGLATLGADVTLVTGTPAVAVDDATFPILRAPSASALVSAIAKADVVLQNTISLRLGWPLLFVRRPLVIAHHMWIDRSGPGALLGRTKHLLTRAAINVAVSNAIAQSLTVPSTVISNPYDDGLFREDTASDRRRDLVFAGRLIADKGLHVALQALAVLRARGHKPTLTVIGSGPEQRSLRAQCTRLNLDEQVSFRGALRGAALVAELNAHRVLLVPSIWEEPFGIVALEGLACGLVPIVSRSGGLPGAVGECGVVVPKCDPDALATAIARIECDQGFRRQLLAGRARHLARHTRLAVTARYLEILTAAPNARVGR